MKRILLFPWLIILLSFCLSQAYAQPNATITVSVSLQSVTNLLLTIVSEPGTGLPPVQVYTNVYGATLTNRIAGVEINGGTQYVAVGWSMTGNDPVAGSGTNMVMVQTNNAMLTWLWSTNYMLTIVPPLHGAITNATSGWQTAGGTRVLYATNSFGYALGNWLVNNVSAGTANPLLLSMNGAKTVMANFAPIFVDVTANVAWNVQWVFNWRTGTFFGTLTITNTSPKWIEAPIWFEVRSNAVQWLRYPNGFDSNTSNHYVNLSSQFSNQVHMIDVANGKLYLEPTGVVVLTNIELCGRQDPTGLVMAVWVDPPASSPSPPNDHPPFFINLTSDLGGVVWPGQTGWVYTVYYSTNLQQSKLGFFVLASNIESVGMMTAYTNTNHNLGGANGIPIFYRVGASRK